MNEGEEEPTDHSTQHSDPRTSRVVGADDRRECAAQHESFQRQTHDSRPLRYHTAARREEIRNRDANHLRQERNRVHASLLLRALRSTRRTSGTETATAMMTTPCSTSIICFGTKAWMASPPCDSVAKKKAATRTPKGWFLPTRATAIPRKPAPLANPSS